ncbi:MAG: glycoside hydrolase family 30 beta sandwich domain-containing protein [Raoultibacter sp.]
MRVFAHIKSLARHVRAHSGRGVRQMRVQAARAPLIEVFTSSAVQRMDLHPAHFSYDPGAEMDLTKLYPDQRLQRVSGFGAALTEAAAYTLSQLPWAVQNRVLNLSFGAAGNAYNLARIPVQSCDFAQGNYAYVSQKSATDLQDFSLAHDEEHLFPLFRAVQSVQPAVEFFASPWSPPAFMKTNRSMNFGGRLLPKYYDRWARVLVRYVQQMRGSGFAVSRLSLQNEPNAAQRWDSCLFSAEEERIFAVDFLHPALVEAGLGDVSLFCWDHNKERILDRAQATLRDYAARSAFGGVAFHWYAGDHFEALRHACALFPDKEFIHTEGCVEYARGDAVSSVEAAEHYAHDIIGDFNAGAHGYIDWNVLLDAQGGPNHAHNYCDAPLMATEDGQDVRVNLSHTYIGHFSHFVAPGAQVCLVSRSADALEALGFVNPDGGRVLVLLNAHDAAASTHVCEGDWVCPLTLEPHSIATLVWTPGGQAAAGDGEAEGAAGEHAPEGMADGE